MSEIFTRAEQFIWHNARLLERHLFAFHFKRGAREAVLSALLAYQNSDGGFGNALEPDIRCPASQPVPAQHALEMLDAVGFDHALAGRICDYLLTITTDEGGVPFVLPSVRAYPHQPWWNSDDNPPAALNPTAAIAGLLHKHNLRHAWLERADAFCWSKIPSSTPDDMHEMGVILTFLRYAPQRERADHEFARLTRHLLASGLVADLGSNAYVRKPLDWAPTPDHPCRSLFAPALIAANLDELLATQQPDGGWSIAWPALSGGSEMEWRGWVTLAALLTLRDNGRL